MENRIKLKKRAVSLREAGKSLSEISTGIGVAKSTISQWCKDVPFVPGLSAERRVAAARRRSSVTKHARAFEMCQAASSRALEEVGKLSKRDLFMLGIGVYTGSGARNDKSIRIISSDPRIIRLSVRWLLEIAGLSKENIAIAIHCGMQCTVRDALRYWSKEVGIPCSQFRKTQVDSRKGKRGSARKNQNFGTIHLTVVARGDPKKGVVLARTIVAWKDRALNS